jgi:hypothetical protein
MKLRHGPDAAKAEFCQESTVVDFLQESSARGVGNLEYGSKHPLSQGVEVSAFIRVHRRPKMIVQLRVNALEILLAADQRR